MLLGDLFMEQHQIRLILESCGASGDAYNSVWVSCETCFMRAIQYIISIYSHDTLYTLWSSIAALRAVTSFSKYSAFQAGEEVFSQDIMDLQKELEWWAHLHCPVRYKMI